MKIRYFWLGDEMMGLKVEGERIKRKLIYMVSIPENGDYAEWWYIVGLFSTRKGAEEFIKIHPIRKYEQDNGSMKPRTRYDEILAIEIDKAPLLEKWNIEEYFGKDKHLTKRQIKELVDKNPKLERVKS